MAVVAARQWMSPAFRRRTPVRRHSVCLAAACRPVLVLVLGFIAFGALDVVTTAPVFAQTFTYNPMPPKPKPVSYTHLLRRRCAAST